MTSLSKEAGASPPDKASWSSEGTYETALIPVNLVERVQGEIDHQTILACRFGPIGAGRVRRVRRLITSECYLCNTFRGNSARSDESGVSSLRDYCIISSVTCCGPLCVSGGAARGRMLARQHSYVGQR
jgi:hypothetical protein